jgi:hypothetical protein
MKTVLLVCAVLLVGPTGCAMQQKKVTASLQNAGPVDCSTAKGDLRVLQSEKANVAERIVEGVTAIYPAGAVLGIVTGTETTKVKVALGDYDQMIDNRIAQIKSTCGL